MRLFLRTIGRRILMLLIAMAPPEAMDADGVYRTLVARRPRQGDVMEQSNFDAVRCDMLSRSETPGPAVIILPVVLLMLVAAFTGPMLVSMGPRSLTFMLVPLLVSGAIIWSQWWTQKNTLAAAEEKIFAAWLRQGCCPHCTYRLTPPESDGRLRCTECGVCWSRPLPQPASPAPAR